MCARAIVAEITMASIAAFCSVYRVQQASYRAKEIYSMQHAKYHHTYQQYCLLPCQKKAAPRIANKLCLQERLPMTEPSIQLLLKADSITVNASMFEGVLTTKTFEGPDCYLKLVDFLKQTFMDQAVQALISVG